PSKFVKGSPGTRPFDGELLPAPDCPSPIIASISFSTDSRDGAGISLKELGSPAFSGAGASGGAPSDACGPPEAGAFATAASEVPAGTCARRGVAGAAAGESFEGCVVA